MDEWMDGFSRQPLEIASAPFTFRFVSEKRGYLWSHSDPP